MPAQLDVIQFDGDNLLTTLVDGQPYVVLKTAFENIGLTAHKQIQKVQRQAWATTALTGVVAADGRVREMVVADLQTFLMALATMQVSRVAPAARPKLEKYQNEVAGVINAYYTRGAAINPRVTEEQLPEVLTKTLADYRTEREQRIAEAEAEQTARANICAARLRLIQTGVDTGLIDASWGRTKAQVQIAAGLGEVPVIRDQELPVYVEDYLKRRGVRKATVRRFAGAFGGRLQSVARDLGVEIPGKRQQELPDGTIREITAWTKAHLPVFDTAWDRYYANDSRLAA